VIEIDINQVALFGQTVKRPDYVSVNEWQTMWTIMQDVVHSDDEIEKVEDLKVDIEKVEDLKVDIDRLESENHQLYEKISELEKNIFDLENEIDGGSN